MSTEDRLRDALGEFRIQAQPSRNLLAGIDEQPSRRRRDTWLRAPIAAVLVAAITIAAVVVIRADEDDPKVASDAVTRASFVVSANRACVETLDALRRAPVVFSTPGALAIVAGKRAVLTRNASESLDALRAPPRLQSFVNEAKRAILDAVVAAARAKEAADTGDVAEAQASLRANEDAIAYSYQELADVGAKRCARPGFAP